MRFEEDDFVIVQPNGDIYAGTKRKLIEKKIIWRILFRSHNHAKMKIGY